HHRAPCDLRQTVTLHYAWPSSPFLRVYADYSDTLQGVPRMHRFRWPIALMLLTAVLTACGGATPAAPAATSAPAAPAATNVPAPTAAPAATGDLTVFAAASLT